MRPDRPALLTACAALAAAALCAPLVTPAVVVLFAVIAVMRLLWLEQNIFEDLSSADRMPPGYEDVSRRTEQRDPLMLATAMRAEAQLWTVALLGALSSLLWAGWGGLAGLLGWAAAFGLGLYRADRLAGTLTLLAQGRPLPAERLRRPVSVAMSHEEDDR